MGSTAGKAGLMSFRGLVLDGHILPPCRLRKRRFRSCKKIARRKEALEIQKIKNQVPRLSLINYLRSPIDLVGPTSTLMKRIMLRLLGKSTRQLKKWARRGPALLILFTLPPPFCQVRQVVRKYDDSYGVDLKS